MFTIHIEKVPKPNTLLVGKSISTTTVENSSKNTNS
jgi:hypothetical protein